jgi:hypothetical protein
LDFDFALSGLELLGIIVVGRCPTLMIQGFQPCFKKQRKKNIPLKYYLIFNLLILRKEILY